jgi:hypothetical protein
MGEVGAGICVQLLGGAEMLRLGLGYCPLLAYAQVRSRVEFERSRFALLSQLRGVSSCAHTSSTPCGYAHLVALEAIHLGQYLVEGLLALARSSRGATAAACLANLRGAEGEGGGQGRRS